MALGARPSNADLAPSRALRARVHLRIMPASPPQTGLEINFAWRSSKGNERPAGAAFPVAPNEALDGVPIARPARVRAHPVRHDREIVHAALRETLAAESDIVAAYLFGSLARGTAGPLSDVGLGRSRA